MRLQEVPAAQRRRLAVPAGGPRIPAPFPVERRRVAGTLDLHADPTHRQPSGRETVGPLPESAEELVEPLGVSAVVQAVDAGQAPIPFNES